MYMLKTDRGRKDPRIGVHLEGNKEGNLRGNRTAMGPKIGGLSPMVTSR